MDMLLKSMVTGTPCCLQLQQCASVFFYGQSSLAGHENLVSLTHVSSLSRRLWQMALSRIVVGTGTAGIELLVVIIMNGNPLRFPHLGSR